MVSTFAWNVILWLALLPAAPMNGQAQSYAQTRSPHGNLNIPCQNCHTALGWKPIRAVPEFNHNATKFPLRGLHEGVSCTNCHTKPVFSNVGSKCADCHADIHRGQLSARCEQCHTVTGWKVSVQAIQNHQNRFPLLGAHAAVECDACHKNGALSNFSATSTDCYSCHASDFSKTSNPNHVAGQFSTNCAQCHGFDNWLNAKFDHSASGFPLTGVHATTPCASCHTNNNYNLSAANTACVNCHQADFQKANNPVHTGPGFSTNCQQCHTTNGWMPATFDHSTVGFALTGFHANPSVTCVMCHVNNNYTLSSTACVSCHQQDYNNATTPVNHVQLGFPTTCQQCHDTTNWTNAKFDHASTGWPLTGFHLTSVQCAQCHTNNNYSLTTADTACVNCHLKDFNGANNPNHVSNNFAQTCEVCHNTAAWQPAQFDHSKSGFPLTGYHANPAVTCVMCHVNNNYNLTSANTACVSCHQQDYNTATTPVNHIQLGFPTTCQQCHDTVLWTDGKFDHSTTGWPLTGFHLTSTQCSQCHINNNYNLTSANTTCVGCHQQDYNTATTPINHVQLGFPTTCQQCHDTVLWTDGKFDHSTTGWPLTGFHLTSTQCAQCHINNNYNLTSANTACVSCHQQDYNTATTPVNHIQLGFPLTCQGCHDTVLWTDGKFDHSTTGWPLTGFHLTSTQCAQCHINNNYNLTTANTVCVGCHQQDYNTATTPVNHIAAGFPTTCELCHDTVLWTDGRFDHSTTGWPLTGFHLTSTQCAQCHVNNNYKLNNTACVACHQTDYNNALSPVNHIAAGFPTTCQICHDTVLWTDGTFNHNNTPFPLTGYHALPPPTMTCAMCHVNNNYTTLPTDCYSCHVNDYNGTNNPNHKAAGFPTTCATCHTTASWLGATFNHTWFPTNHGNANGVCSTCHTNPNDFTVFTCTNCHQKAQTDQNHQGVNGYVYNSVNCYNCHKNGGGGG